MKAAPTVNLNTAALIKELVGEYNDDTEWLIHAIASNEKELIKNCNTMADYKDNMQAFINLAQ